MNLVIIFCLVLTFYAALLTSLIVTPWVRTAARRFDFVDHPDGGRKTHSHAIALCGGVAVLISAVVAVLWAMSAASAMGQNLLEGLEREYAGLMGAVLVIVFVGLIDDRISLRGWYKLAGQIAACCLLMGSGLLIEQLSVLGWNIELGVGTVPFTLLWMLAAINAINLIDGIDGLASTVGIVLCLTLTALAIMVGNYVSAIVVLALAGALLGFLRYNFAPASIFLGDSGSMLIGLVIGAVAIASSMKEAATMTMAIPFAVCAIPLLDSAAAIVRRKLTGRSVFVTDRGHFHHVLLVRGWSVRQTVVIIGLMCAVTCGGALVGLYFRQPIVAIITVLGMVAFLVVTKTFGHVEFALVTERVRSTASALADRRKMASSDVRQSCIQLQGSEEWREVWAALTESTEDYDLCRIELTLNLPALHEVFYATWDSGRHEHKNADPWRLASPLIVDSQTIGKIVVTGAGSEGSSFAHIGQIADFLEPIEEDIQRIVGELTARKQSASAAVATGNESAKDAQEAVETHRATSPG